MDFYASKINKDVVIVYINKKLLPISKEIIQKIRELGKKCNFEITPDSNIIFYFQMPDISKNQDAKMLFNVIKKNTNNILGFFTYRYFPQHLEIYDVCVPPEYRNQGIIKTIFIDFLKNVPKNYKIWLGVKMDNQMRDIVINLYLSLGFKYLDIGYRSFSGQLYPFLFVSMILDRNYKTSLKDTNLQIYNGLKSLETSKVLYLNYDVSLSIYQNFSHKANTEYGGIMKADYKGFLNPEKIVKGDEFSVVIPDSCVNWHTHPNICYIKTQCYIGWPSGKDMQLSFLKYYTNERILHFVFAEEGLYIVRLTGEMMKFIHIISNNQDWVGAIADLIDYRFTFLERYRSVEDDKERLKCLDKYNTINCLTFRSETKTQKIKNFLDRANNKTLKEYIVYGEEYVRLMFDNYPIDEQNNLTLEAIKYYENFTNTIQNFPIFKVDYVDPLIFRKSGFLNIKLDYLRTPVCF